MPRSDHTHHGQNSECFISEASIISNAIHHNSRTHIHQGYCCYNLDPSSLREITCLQA